MMELKVRENDWLGIDHVINDVKTPMSKNAKELCLFDITSIHLAW